ncbi:hypothetical protein V9K97_27150 [Variovorax sp. CCNWLW186]|uniref:hypothetical protein n=1 Tax=Variovorax paradoxus TaxID=34073 RepID=UPI00037EC062|nr:hypothetical protein [Variovorax paradoxus]
MKRDAVNLDQLALFEPDAPEALRLMSAHSARFERAADAAEFWEVALCPGARDEATKQAEEAYRAWLVCAIFLDLERLL